MSYALVVVESLPYSILELRSISADCPILYIFRYILSFPIIVTNRGSKEFPAYSAFATHIAAHRGNEVYPIVWLKLFNCVILKAFYPLVLGVSSHNRMLIHPQFGIHFHLNKMSDTLGDIIFSKSEVQSLCSTISHTLYCIRLSRY
jgi:hypothetical protein